MKIGNLVKFKSSSAYFLAEVKTMLKNEAIATVRNGYCAGQNIRFCLKTGHEIFNDNTLNAELSRAAF
jgi:hypothetical protein